MAELVLPPHLGGVRTKINTKWCSCSPRLAFASRPCKRCHTALVQAEPEIMTILNLTRLRFFNLWCDKDYLESCSPVLTVVWWRKMNSQDSLGWSSLRSWWLLGMTWPGSKFDCTRQRLSSSVRYMSLLSWENYYSIHCFDLNPKTWSIFFQTCEIANLQFRSVSQWVSYEHQCKRC